MAQRALRCILHLKGCTQSPVSGASCSLTRSKSVTEHPLRQTVELVVQTWPCAPGSCGRTVCMLIVTGLTNACTPPVKHHLMCVVLLQQSSKECHGGICMRHEQQTQRRMALRRWYTSCSTCSLLLDQCFLIRSGQPCSQSDDLSAAKHSLWAPLVHVLLLFIEYFLSGLFQVLNYM